MRFWSILAGGLISGLIAGIVLGFLLLRFSAPLIISAERYETAKHVSDEHRDDAKASGTRTVATFTGALILSTIHGVLLAAVFSLTAPKTYINPLLRGLLFGFMAYVIIFLVPAFAFPPSPPGLEFKASAGERQAWWLAIIAAEAIGLMVYRAISRSRWTPAAMGLRAHTFKQTVAVAAGGIIVLATFALRPASGRAQSVVPATLVRDFRFASGFVMLGFWLILGLTVGAAYLYLVQNNHPERK